MGGPGLTLTLVAPASLALSFSAGEGLDRMPASGSLAGEPKPQGSRAAGRLFPNGAYEVARKVLFGNDARELGIAGHVAELAARILGALWSQAPRGVERPSGNVLRPQLFPLPDGGVQLEWHAGANHLEVAIELDGSVSIIAESGDATSAAEIAPALDPIPAVALSALGRISDDVWSFGARPTH